MLLDLDRCSGCYTCQTACRELNGYGYDEQWMQVVRRDPYYVDGKLRMYHLVAPSLDKCAQCFDKDNDVLCVKNCATKALRVGKPDDLIPLMDGNHCALYVK
jgi:Fe-S-cluster-containing dehydrogenase component